MKYTTFQTLTVGQYQELYRINRSEDEDKDINSVSVLTGMTANAIADLPYTKFNDICREVNKIFETVDFAKMKKSVTRPKAYIKIGGKRFGIIYDPATLSTGQYISIQTWMRSNLIENLDKIFASLVYPVEGVFPFLYRGKISDSDHPKIAEQIRDCNFMQVHSACVFFLTLWRNSINSLRDFLTREAVKNGMEPKLIQGLLKKLSDGFLTPSELQTLKT